MRTFYMAGNDEFLKRYAMRTLQLNDANALTHYSKGLPTMHPIFLLITALFATAAIANSTGTASKPQSLMAIYNLALAHDPTLASALNANKAAQELIEQAKALYRPIVNFSAGANASQTDVRYKGTGIPFPNGVRSYEGYQVGVEARQPLFRKQNLVQMEQLHTQVSQADKQLHLTMQNLMLRTTQSYFETLVTQDKLDLIGAQKAAILSQLEQAKARFDVGSATITDTNEAQARFDLTIAQEIAAQNALEIAKRNLQAITGELPRPLAKVRADLKPNALTQKLDEWLKVAADSNLNIQIQQDLATLAGQEIERNQAGHLPTVDAVASYTETSTNGSNFGFGSDINTGTIGVELNLPLYQGGATSSRIRQAVLNKQKALDDVEIARRQTELDTQTAYLNLNSSIAQVKAYEQALSSSQSQLDSTQTGYDVGIRTGVDVLDAQRQLFAAKRDLLEARYQYLLNIIRLKAAVGVIGDEDLADVNRQLEGML
ncbi:MAG: TolC family outer membrane protein [Methylovulum sp.]|uniref:TolC family outer membrane protein n=1 Tax=Methylovulum sp. TaxID=1916980 RepID=UPI0026045180|nr:TolC family outer membrane protein [Methylovulum sp.]MDD2724601.1 TolC family outer membrane protein [Methylovulum sp.]MDD5123373.1 TolC family outer membrane protein [Methylovulum sp.]